MLYVLLVALCFAASSATALTHVATHTLPPGTHCPEILGLPDGSVMVVVVQPEGPPAVGASKHKAYRLDADYRRVRRARRPPRRDRQRRARGVLPEPDFQ